MENTNQPILPHMSPDLEAAGQQNHLDALLLATVGTPVQFATNNVPMEQGESLTITKSKKEKKNRQSQTATNQPADQYSEMPPPQLQPTDLRRLRPPTPAPLNCLDPAFIARGQTLPAEIIQLRQHMSVFIRGVMLANLQARVISMTSLELEHVRRLEDALTPTANLTMERARITNLRHYLQQAVENLQYAMRIL